MFDQKLKHQILLTWQRGQSLPHKMKITELAQLFGIAHSTATCIVRNYSDKIQRYEQLIAAKDGGQPVKPKSNIAGDIVLVIPDLHCPWEHPDALEFLKAVRRAYKPTRIVCLGDEVDFHNYSKWPKDPDVISAGQELQAAIDHLTPFYLEFPKVDVCVSNHTIRPQKIMKQSGLPEAFFPRYSTMLNAPDGWEWHEHIIIDNVRYMHGDQGKAGQKGWTSNTEVYHQSTVVGHWHSKAGAYYDSEMFNMNTGCLIWPPAKAFGYAKNSHKKPNIGCGLVMYGKEAYYIPMNRNENGRWTGRLHG